MYDGKILGEIKNAGKECLKMTIVKIWSTYTDLEKKRKYWKLISIKRENGKIIKLKYTILEGGCKMWSIIARW